MTEDLNSRIAKMFGRDRAMAISFVVCLWLAVGFVFFAVNATVEDGGVRIALIVGSVLVLIFNTASITAMLRHYMEDKHFIYDIDIRHLDEARERKEAMRTGSQAFTPNQ